MRRGEMTRRGAVPHPRGLIITSQTEGKPGQVRPYVTSMISGEATQHDVTRLAGRTVAVLFALGRKRNRLCIAGSKPRG